MQRALPKAYIIDGDGQLRARGERSYLFWYTPPSPEDIARARTGETVVIQDWENNEFWALLQLTAFADHFLYVSRDVDGKILSLLDETQETVRLYQQLEVGPRAAALRVRAGLPRLRARGDPGRDVDGPLVRRAAGAAGRPAGRRRRAGRAGRPRRPGARGAGRRRDRAARAHLQRDDPPGEGPARRADRRQRRDRAAAAALRLGAVGRDRRAWSASTAPGGSR